MNTTGTPVNLRLARITEEYLAALGEERYRYEMLAQATREAMAAGMTPAAAARFTGMDETTVRRWASNVH